MQTTIRYDGRLMTALETPTVGVVAAVMPVEEGVPATSRSTCP